jgi:hypothetical protein
MYGHFGGEGWAELCRLGSICYWVVVVVVVVLVVRLLLAQLHCCYCWC